ncbi:RHS repeat-associated core domain-containing protein [Pelomonas sp. SE-A7]|uniref:RHS repeat domain-containing protein n=1 Tax=Pelomonas sp. SE-A7 TaxID=3054953 RepID=UPI00259CD11E|nr:RHS repeat-associated core domain-containing protein [Pelomonas sp. SE-A7]MDM4766036.1 RHS repeat-associated core domain-containing protein [Pelomonas sp. SE-A7]
MDAGHCFAWSWVNRFVAMPGFSAVSSLMLRAASQTFPPGARMISCRPRRFIGCLLWLLAVGPGMAQDALTPDKEYGKFVATARTVSPMSEFGDSVNLRDGALSLRATDIELRGKGPVIRITRSFQPGGMSEFFNESSGNAFGRWELEIPRIKTITADMPGATPSSPYGWQVTGPNDAYKNQRCSNFAAPGRVTFFNDAARSWNAADWWNGYQLVDDSGGSQALMSRTDSTVNPSYKLMTMGNWLVSCLSSTANGQPGEAFFAVAPDGTKYWFNYLVYAQADTLQKPLWSVSPGLSSSTADVASGVGAPPVTPHLVGDLDFLDRRYAAMLVTRIEDRFGNWVSYSYSQGRVTSIDASDGRHVGFVFDGSGRISAVTAGTGNSARTWAYSYAGTTQGTAALTVSRPDGSSWWYQIPILTASSLNVQSDPTSSCTLSAYDYDQFTEGSIVSPAGATMTLRFNRKRFARSFVHKQCWGGVPGRPETGYALYPREWYAWALDKRTITGSGLSSMSWTYAYAPPVSSWYQDCSTPSSCASTVWTEVTNPQGHRHRSTFSNKFDETENKLLREEIYSDTGQLLRSIDHGYATVAAGAPNPFPWPLWVGDDKQTRVNPLTRGRWTPSKQTVTTQDGVTFTRTVNAFDSYARPTSVTRASSLGYSRTEITGYADRPALWVMGQLESTSVGSLVPVLNTYEASTANLLSTKSFGVTQASYAWNSDGTLASRTDGAGRSTTFSNWYRGLPRSITYPTGAAESATVNEHGWITSVTDAANYTTSYGYDALGRLTSVVPPGSFNTTALSFSAVADAEYGLAAGHWRQTVTQGHAVTKTYFDALWRPVMTRSYDASNESASRKVATKQYDADGRIRFQSYPATDISTYDSLVNGVQTSYDGLGRTTSTTASSELGALVTSTSYLSGFQTQQTNPRGKLSTQGFWVLDDPSGAKLASISAPAGVTISITRDSFGKPTAIARSGTYAGYSSNVTRRYVYDSGQRLCKTIEPEVGSTVQTYDAAGNLAWKAPGQSLPGTANCDDTSVAAAAKISYGYDNLNRLTSVSYGDGSPGVTRSYTADGLLQSIASNGSAWTYGYNALRKLSSESLSYGGQTYAFAWSYDTQGNLSSLSYPNGSTVAYSPNALGEAQAVSGHASGISYHPNGAVAGYTLANGVVHSLSLNARGLPLVNKHSGVVQDQYTYDANGNVTGITDQFDGSFSRSMSYDDLDRLSGTSAPGVWGTATYAYDTVDNLRSAVVGARASTFNFTSSNQLASVTTNGATTSYGFDARGNLLSKGGQSFGFDLGNRLTSSSLGGSYVYDGHGRRIKVVSSDGSTRLQMYSQQGQLLWATSTGGGRPTSTTAYIYLAGKQIAEVNSVAGTQYVHADALGSPVARTNAARTVLNRLRFEPFGYVAAGTKPSPATSVIGFTGHVQDAETDLVYMQQRYYDPIAGRFLSVDPVVTNANSGKSFGRYHYANNNPYRYVDDDGRDAVGFLVKLLDNGGKIFLKKVDKAEAVAARRSGQNVQAATKSDAKQIEIAARNGDKGGVMQHKGHELKDGSTGDPHFQTEGVEGHTFWGSQSGAVLPELLEALLIPILATPTSLAPGTLYGPGTPYKNQQEYDKAMKEKEEKRKPDEEKKPKPEDQK